MPKLHTWTRLAASAYSGEYEITLEQVEGSYPDWEIGDEIVIAPSGWDPEEAEIRIVSAYIQNTGTVTFSEPLNYNHLVWLLVEDSDLASMADSNADRAEDLWWYNQRELAPEVGLLTHNIVIQGQ